MKDRDILVETVQYMLKEIDEAEALRVFYAMRDRYGWTGTVFTREDVEAQLNRDLTPEEWERVHNSSIWNKGVQESMIERGWETVGFMCGTLELSENYEEDE